MDAYKRSLFISMLSIPLGFLAECKYRRLASIPFERSTGNLPSLSIIIPARDELHNLQVILPSLLRIQYSGKLEILVVDDHSTDGTSNIAKSFGVGVLRLDKELPMGWNGKPYACHQGALMAKGDWFLFTDADTVHTSDGISRAVSFAENTDLDGLSLFIKYQGDNWLHNLPLDTAFAGFFTSWNQSIHMLNGQFILIHRTVYFESGGFESVRDEALEDVALGHLLTNHGYRLEILNGDDIASVNMYKSFRQMFNGLSRLGANTLRWQGLRAVLTVLNVAALVSPILILWGALRGRLKWTWVPLAWGSSTLSLLPWSRRSGASIHALFAPLGALIFMIAAIYGLLMRIFRGGIIWKGRKV